MNDTPFHRPPKPPVQRPDQHGRLGRIDSRGWHSPVEVARAQVGQREVEDTHAREVLAGRAEHGEGWRSGEPLRSHPVRVTERQADLLGDIAAVPHGISEKLPQIKSPTLRVGAKLLPGVGVIATVATVGQTYDLVRAAARGDASWAKAGAAIFSDGAAFLGGIVGASDVAREAVHHASSRLLGEKNASPPSDIAAAGYEVGNYVGTWLKPTPGKNNPRQR